MTSIVRSRWYVAAYGREVTRTVFGRTVCGESILLWRREDGSVTAMGDRCMHRRFPLSEEPSHVVGDTVVCGYHGFTYGADGVCVAVPGQRRIPRTARLKTYPIVEQDGFVWVYIGDDGRDGDVVVPRAPWLEQSGWTTVSGMEPLAARASLMIDNLMDLSHETYLHGGHIGTPEVAETPITTELDEAAQVVRVTRHMDDAACPPFYAKSTGITGSDPGGFHVEVVYAITHETECTTHDFWAVARDFALDDEDVSTFLAESNRTVVLQDVAALDALERVLVDEPDGYQELSMNIDTGGLAARRLIADQSAAVLEPIPDGARPVSVR